MKRFRRGDVVEYVQTKAGKTTVEAVVYACCYAEKEGKPQGRKILVLYDMEGGYFFLGSWAAWRRVSKAGTRREA